MATDAAFLTYYLNELDQLRVAGSAFARTHRHLAGALDFHGAGEDDPQVARLIESFAFLTARLQQQFEDEFPQIPTALLEALYAPLVAPVPAMAIAEFRTSAKQDRALEGLVVPRETAIYATTAHGAECRFRTGSALPLWPIAVTAVTMPAPGGLDCLNDHPAVAACVRVTLSCIGAARTFAQLAPKSLRFYVDGDRNGRFKLFEALCTSLIGIATVAGGVEAGVARFPAGLALRPVGLEPTDALLPYPDASHHGYRLLQEYFHFPDKFMFLELSGLAPGMLGDGGTIDLLFMLDAEPNDPIRVDAKSLRLGCVPIVNLFPQTSEPIRLDHLSVDYPLEPDIRAAGSTEVHTVRGVTRSAAGEASAGAIPSYFGAGTADGQVAPLRWIARRHPTTNPALTGTDVQLSFVDPAMNPMVPAEDVLFAQLLCTNRTLARQVTNGTRFAIESDLPIDIIQCLARPTPPADPPMAGENLWRLVSHLSLNALSLGDAPGRLDALKQILFLYSGTDDNTRKRKQINGIGSMTTRPVVRRLGSRQWRGFVRGTEIALRLRDDHFVGGSAYLFGSVLERFLALYAGVNSFTELVIRREHDDEEWKRWPARAGDRFVL